MEDGPNFVAFSEYLNFNLLLEVFYNSNTYVHGTNQNGNTWDVETYGNKLKNTIFRSMPPSFDGKIEKSFARAKK